MECKRSIRAIRTVLEHTQNLALAQVNVVSSLANILGQLCTHVCALFLIQPLNILGEISNEEEQDDRDHTGQNALDNEHPPPATVAAHAIHLCDSTGKQTTEGAGQRCGAKEETETLLSLRARVPHAQQIETCRSQLALALRALVGICTYIQGTCLSQRHPKRIEWPLVHPSSVPDPGRAGLSQT